MKYVKSPLNYTGGKYKLLGQIIPLFPNNIDTFVDLFCGGCNVGINVEAKSVICNDKEQAVIDLMRYFNSNEVNDIIVEIEKVIEKYGLTDTYRNGYEFYGCNSSSGVAKINKDGYMKLREYYNQHQHNPLLFYCVVIFAFSNQIRFNSKGEFNVAVNKRDFNVNLRKNLVAFVNALHGKNIYFSSYDFTQVDLSKLTKDDLVYCDPPYLITCANYNENGGWNETKERELLDLLDKLNERGVKFALSNVLENKGKSNDILKEWATKYNIHYLNHTYGNCNYHTKDKSRNSTVEVLITNY